MPITLTARNTDLPTLADLLKDQRARSIDLIAGANRYEATADGKIKVSGADPIMDDDGVTDPNGTYDVTEVGDEGLAAKLGIHASYMRRMRETGRTDLWAANVNGWLHGNQAAGHGPHQANLMLRMLRGDVTGSGVLRAVLSDRYNRIDNLDVLVAALGGLRDSGITASVTTCNLTERNMYVVVEAPEVRALAPQLLAGYRDPFGPGGLNRVEHIRALAQREGMGYEAGQEPVMHAGFVIKNSETGDGQFVIMPRLVVQICRNGYTITADALGRRHIGGRADEGVIAWSDATNRKALDLVASKAKDAVQTFLSPGYLARQIDAMSEAAGTPVTNAADTIKAVAKAAAYPNDLADTILSAFIAGGQLTAGGVAHAVTAAAQTVADADVASAMEESALGALALAARIG